MDGRLKQIEVLRLNTGNEHLAGSRVKFILNEYEPRYEKTGFIAYAKTKTQISCTVTAQLISAFVFTT